MWHCVCAHWFYVFSERAVSSYPCLSHLQVNILYMSELKFQDSIALKMTCLSIIINIESSTAHRHKRVFVGMLLQMLLLLCLVVMRAKHTECQRHARFTSAMNKCAAALAWMNELKIEELPLRKSWAPVLRGNWGGVEQHHRPLHYSAHTQTNTHAHTAWTND